MTKRRECRTGHLDVIIVSVWVDQIDHHTRRSCLPKEASLCGTAQRGESDVMTVERARSNKRGKGREEEQNKGIHAR